MKRPRRDPSRSRRRRSIDRRKGRTYAGGGGGKDASAAVTSTPEWQAAWSADGISGWDRDLPSYDLGESVAFNIEAGLRYQTGLSDLEGLAGTGLEPINDVGSRWSLPVLATLTFRF